MKRAILLLILISFCLSAWAQCPSSLSISAQSQINNFSSNYPNCTEIPGSVRILNTSIISLSGLSQLASIGGDLEVRNTSITNFNGLSNLTSIGGDLYIRETSMSSLAGLDNLTSIGGYLRIFRNGALQSLTGLENLVSISDRFHIEENNSLSNLTPLSNLTSIGTNLVIKYNNSLTNLMGLDNVTSIGGYLYIYGNDDLTSLAGLENISSIPGSMTIRLNANLSLCGNIPSICSYLQDGNTATIGPNAPGCNTQVEVEDACIFLPVEISTPLQARLQNQTAHLTWRTETETNNSGFEIQRSKDGVQWKRVGWEAGQGNTSTPYSYTYIDEQPFSNISYYRLKQVDFDGSFTYTNVASLEYHRTHANIYPNPVKDKLYISTDEQAIDDVIIFDTMGKQINAQVTDNTIDVALLPKGLYTVKVIIGGQYFYEKIVVQ